MAVDPETTDRNLETARQKKATGDVAFKSGNLPDGRLFRQTQLSGLPFINAIMT